MRSRILAPLLGYFAFLLVGLALGSQLEAQQSPDPQKVAAPAGSAPITDVPAVATLKSRTDLVLVPVVVRDKNGKHIASLPKDAFRLEENGKEQSLSLFEEVQDPPDTLLPSPVVDRGYSNLPFDNTQQLRLTIVVLDLLNTTPLQRTDGKDQLVKFLSKGLARNQPVSLLCLTAKGLQLVQPFSTDISALIEALKKFPPGPETIIGRRNAAEGTLKQLREIAQAYAGIPGRKTLILAAGNVPQLVPEHAVFDSSVLASDIRDMWKSLIDADISIYPVQLLAASVDQTGRGRLVARATYTSLYEFASATGGNLCLEDNGFMDCLADAVEDSRSYYMLGFSVRPDDRKPGWRDLKVKVSAERADVRARNGFYFGKPEPTSPKSVRDDEINALASSLAYSAVPMYVRVLPQASTPSAAAAPGQNTTIKFMVTIPLAGLRIDPSNPNALDLEIGAIALTRDTREAAKFLHPLRGNPKAEALQQLGREGLKVGEKLELPSGSYDVRFMARDNNAGLIGTEVFPLEVK